MQLPPIATTTVGSFPRPGWLGSSQRSQVTFHVGGASLREALDDATVLILREQEEIGLDLLSDGEQRRPHFINYVLATWDGVDLHNTGIKRIYRRRSQERRVPRVVGEVKRRSPAVLEDVCFAKAHTSRPLKMAVPGPMTVVDSTLDEAYGDEEALAMDVATAINAELRDLQAAGCDALQIDEPAMTRYHEKVAAYGARALDRCLEGIHTPTIVHLCYGYPGGGSQQHEYKYPDLLEQLMKTQIRGFAVEFGRSNYDPAVLSVCRGRLVMFGCVDPGDSPPPAVETVVNRVRTALQYIDPGNLLLAPDCGLMTTSRELARTKARLLVDVARELRRAL
ncbi:MAG: 5-methyltetrahydropteroyltriglutamate--homocysteine methyltransferase [Candidatus Binatia bacterium]